MPTIGPNTSNFTLPQFTASQNIISPQSTGAQPTVNRIFTWNAFGLKPEKVEHPVIKPLIETSDILVFVETWLTSEDDIPDLLQHNFTCFSLPAKLSDAGSGRPSGGILICVHKKYTNVSLHDIHEHAGILWIKFRAQSSKDLYIAACYFSPETSTHWTTRNGGRLISFETLLADLLEIDALMGDYIITGDMNARTRDEPDSADLSDLLRLIPDCDMPSQLNILPRQSADMGNINNFGSALLNLCRTAGCCILNGRLPGDATGCCTFKSYTSHEGQSLVDYFIASPHLFFDKNGVAKPGTTLSVIHGLSSQSRKANFSDHWPIHLQLPHGVLPCLVTPEIPHSKHKTNSRQNLQKRWKWNDCLSASYISELKSPESATTLNSILSSESIEHMITSLKSAILSAATNAGLTQAPLFKPVYHNKKRACDRATSPWYGVECKIARGNIDKAENGRAARQALRSYKKIVIKSKHIHSTAREAKIRDLMQHKPKQFWQYMRKSTNAGSSITKQQLFNYYRRLREPPILSTLPSPLIYQYTPDIKPHATSLDKAFQISDINTALDGLKNGKTADHDGNIAELLTKACINGSYILAPHITRIVNAIFTSGSFPTHESLGMIISIYKGNGDSADCNNYRGITIITVLSKLYATILNNRLSAWRMGSLERRARGQGGFLKHHRTTDHIFMLQHFIDKYRTNTSLYTCFVDLSKAFDTISRPKLWQRLHELGIGGNMLVALKAYYADVRECVKTDQGLTEPFQSEIGVKQGCPLSPTLFGFYIDAVEDFICKNIPDGGKVKLDHDLGKIPLLLYADDIVFMARSEQELQQMMDIFSEFCFRYELTVNLKKTKIVVFSSKIKGITANINYRGSLLPQNTSYKYLGVTFQSRFGAKYAGDALLISAKRALFVLQNKLKSENITSPKIALQLYDALVTPIITYGSEIWGCLDSKKRGSSIDLADRLYLSFIKRCLHIPTNTDSSMVLAEVGCLPFHTKIWAKVADYFVRIQKMNDSSRLIDLAFTENLTYTERKCWSTCTSHGLKHLGVRNFLTPTGGKDILQDLSIKATQALSYSLLNAKTDNRDLYTHSSYEHSEGERTRTYCKWFWDRRPSAALDLYDSRIRTELTRFRLGAHDLRIVTGARYNLHRRNRLCGCCNMNIVEDEFHFIFECSAYNTIRWRYRELFADDMCAYSHTDKNISIIITDTDQMMQRLFSRHQDMHKLANYISACRKKRTTIIPVR